MGPAILFDKSAIQGLGQNALAEVGRYFYTLVPHVLLMETLADLSLMPDDLPTAQKKVAEIANKILPIDSITNAHYHTMCVHNLLGDDVPMTRIPAVAGAKPVVAADGSKGMFIDVQPENEAVLRWRSGRFNSDDMNFAIKWRKAAKGSNLEEMKQALPKPPVKLKSPEEVRDFVDLLLAQHEAQAPMLLWFMSLLKCDGPKQQEILVHWKFDVTRTLSSFAPYAYHCLRVQLIYYVGMLQGVFGTRPSNIVDLEYLCYTPFASVFCQRLAEQYPHFGFFTDLFIGCFDRRKVLEQIEGLDIFPFDRMANPRPAFVVLHGERIIFGQTEMSVGSEEALIVNAKWPGIVR